MDDLFELQIFQSMHLSIRETLECSISQRKEIGIRGNNPMVSKLCQSSKVRKLQGTSTLITSIFISIAGSSVTKIPCFFVFLVYEYLAA